MERTLSVSEMLSQYTLVVEGGSPPEGLICIRCKKLLVDAYQACCGCPYCHGCIREYLAQGDIKCSGEKGLCPLQELKLDLNVLKNAFMNQSVLRLRVCCPNESCTFITEVEDMPEHLQSCPEHAIKCPFSTMGCDDESAPKSQIISHISNESLKHSNLLTESMYNLRNDSEKSKLEIQRLQDEIGRNESESREKLKLMTEEIARLSAKIESTKRDNIGEVEGNIPDLELLKTQLMNKDGQSILNEPTARSLLKSQHREKKKESVNNDPQLNVIFFTVSQFSSRKKSKEVIFSPHFYSHTNGYKLKLRVQLGGDDTGTHLAVSFIICRGEFDDLVPWPCESEVTISIISKSKRVVHKSQTFSYLTCKDVNKGVFDKPTANDNVGLGQYKFITLSDLETISDLVVKDSFILQCSVRTHF